MEDKIVTDAKGRKITLRTLNVMDQVRLMRAVGPEQARNEPYFNIVTMAASVSDIDDVPCAIPRSEAQIDGLISRIGDDGFAALMVSMKSQIAEIEAAAQAAADGVVAAGPLALPA